MSEKLSTARARSEISLSQNFSYCGPKTYPWSPQTGMDPQAVIDALHKGEYVQLYQFADTIRSHFPDNERARHLSGLSPLSVCSCLEESRQPSAREDLSAEFSASPLLELRVLALQKLRGETVAERPMRLAQNLLYEAAVNNLS